MKPHAKSAHSLALAIVGGIAAGMRCDASVTAGNSSQINPRPAAYTVKAYTEGSPFVPKGDPHVTQQEIATRLNLSLRGVEDMIKRAREKGLIRRVGGKRFGHWEVVK